MAAFVGIHNLSDTVVMQAMGRVFLDHRKVLNDAAAVFRIPAGGGFWGGVVCTSDREEKPDRILRVQTYLPTMVGDDMPQYSSPEYKAGQSYDTALAHALLHSQVHTE